MSERRTWRLASGLGAIRTETFEGREYLVVPVVAATEGVIRPLGSKVPELVLASELAATVTGWNGRPLMLDHPLAPGDVPMTANEPRTLEAQSLGFVFNARVEEKKLKAEAWIDVAKAAQMGGEAQQVVDRVRAVMAGQTTDTIDVSVGVAVGMEMKQGTHDGKPYGGIWRGIVPDHLAILPSSTGACSVAMGCGLPRVAQQEEGMSEPAKKRTLKERLLELVPFRAALKGFSDSDIRDEMRDALRAIEPAYAYIEAVFETDGYVIYCVSTVDPYEEHYFKRNFELSSDGKVTLEATRVEVEPVMRFEVVAAAADTKDSKEPKEQKAAGCACGKRPAAASTPQSEGDQHMDKDTRIAALMASPHLPPSFKNEGVLKAATECTLKALEAHVEAAKPADPKVPVVEPKAAAEAPKPEAKTEEQWLAEAPASLRDLVVESKAAKATEKTALVAELKAAQTVYSEAELNAMSNDELKKLKKLAQLHTPVDFSGRAPRAAAADDVFANPPDSYAIALEKQGGKAAVN